ncbi:MAG: CPBP family intramembrane metalloprotease [Segetibacter sp.]|nr:CPBP family intramembrane metalloprotease [Segetibacter sp.]
MQEQQPLIKYGWLRALIYFIIAAVIVVIFQNLGMRIVEELGSTTKENEFESIISFGFIYATMGTGIFIITYLIRRFVDRRSFKSLGFTWQGFSDEASLGFFSATALLGAGSLILVGVGYLTFLSFTVNPAAILIELLIMIIVAFVEEVLFRGYLLNNLMQSMNRWIALIISAVLFALFHGSNPDINVIAIVNIFLAGLFLGLNYIYTKNLWFGIFFHFAWNFFQGPVLGFEVSGLKLQTLFQQLLTGPELWTGGEFGFEGSLLCHIMISLSIAGLAYGFSKKYSNQNVATI